MVVLFRDLRRSKDTLKEDGPPTRLTVSPEDFESQHKK